ncbi:hypothetical protein [Photobacterium damselae]|uniref:hypothetical protein n=1 Tax=Photobacterium damselae TaxID=38293 RepID=UPI001F436C6A|nr:hypothetical protein [Photobacterium damselae]UKA03998.1 hypothetical protein IHC89_15835 [Photobacterium damselae subsp. damselae]
MTSKLLPWTLFLSMLSPMTQAISIDSMLVFANQNGEGTFTIGNTEDYRQFLNVVLYDLDIVDGEYVKTRYTSQNLADWEISVKPARSILEPGFKKSFLASYPTPKNLESDKLYQIGFVPTPYFDKENVPKQIMQMAVGFAAIFVVPTNKDYPIKYEMNYTGHTLNIKNTGKSLVNISVNGCSINTPKNKEEKCKIETTVFSGRDLTLNLPLTMQVPTLKVLLRTFKDKRVKRLTINKGGVI